MIRHSIPLAEPQRGKELLTKANQYFVSNDTLVHIAPLLTDGLVFVYPVLLVVLYVMGMAVGREEWRYGALYIFSSAVVATILNMCIQFIVDKQRPEGYIDNPDLLIMDHLPTAPFPSDHATVSAAVAMSLLLWSLHAGYTKLALFAVVLLCGSLVMSFARVSVAIHRPTDVIVGFLLGVLVAFTLHRYIYDDTVLRRLFAWVISVQEWMFTLIGLAK